MRLLALIPAVLLIVLPLVDAFETILQPRRIMHRFRFSRLYYRWFWRVWRAATLRIRPGKRREAFVSVFGPLSLLGLFVAWVTAMIFGFALIHWSLRTTIARHTGFGTCVYFSGSEFFTLGYDLTTSGTGARELGVVEGGLGFGFLAVIISYLPVLYQAFSRREATISLLDARAGSPPSALHFLGRLARSGNLAAADRFLAEWEQWCAELLESQLSFPVLGYYRSQHDNQSWLATLAMILDTCSILMVSLERDRTYQAQLTFAMARHAAVDLALVLRAHPTSAGRERLSDDQLVRVSRMLREAGVDTLDSPATTAKLSKLRGMYDPFIDALADRFLLAVPHIAPEGDPVDNWQRSAWMQRAPGINNLPGTSTPNDEHF